MHRPTPDGRITDAAVPQPINGPDTAFHGCDYSSDELELIKAIDRFKRTHGKRFVSCVEVLRIAKSIGWTKPPSRSD